MKYYGEFKSIDKINYRVEFLVSDGAYTSEREVTLGAEPFSTTMDDGGNTIYKPVKYCGATSTIITGNYYFNLYNQTNTNVGVILKQGSNVRFKGYVTPNMYDMGFKYDREEIEIECVDCLSVLKNINYLPDDRGIKTLKDILLYIFRQLPEPNINSLNTPWLKSFYFPENITINGSNHPLEEIYVSEYAFTDEKKQGEEDKDACWKCSEVLEAICQLFGVTCVQWGDNVHFIDYDYITQEANAKYSVYNIATGEASYGIIRRSKYTITGESYSGEGSPQLSLDNVYNKVTVKTKLRTYDSILPDFFDGATNITGVDTALENQDNVQLGIYGINIQSEVNPKDGLNRNMICLVDQIYNDQKKKYGPKNAVFVRYFKNPAIACKSYSTVSTGAEVTTPDSMTYIDSKFYRGALLAKMMVKKLDKYDNVDQLFIKWPDWKIEVRRTEFDYLMARNEINNISLSNYICLFNPVDDNHRIENGSDPFNYPYLETNISNLTSFFGGKNTYLIISGTILWHYKDDEPYPTPEGEYDPREGRRETSTINYLYLPCKLQWGNKYWDGEKWTTTNTGFKLYYTEAINYSNSPSFNYLQSKTYRADALICKEWKIPNSVTWRIGSSEDGYPIPIPEGELLSGTPKFTIFRPWDPIYNKADGNKYKPNRMFLKDFKINSVITDPTYSKDTNTDTFYTNIIDENFVNELKEVTFNISTFDNKKPSYNTIAYKDGYNYKYVDKVINSALTSGETTWTGADLDAPDSTNGLRFEEHFIYRIVNQYSAPSRILNVALHTKLSPYAVVKDTVMDDCSFIIDSIKNNYKYNTQELRLIEKK